MIDTVPMRPAKPLLIGLTGRAGAGKSTVAAMLGEYAFMELAFADPIVEMAGALFGLCGIDGAWMVERSLKEQPTVLGVSYRKLAQTLGTEVGRHIDPDIWLRVMGLRLQAIELREENVVISDVRFPNEADWITARGGIVVRVLRDGTQPVRQHASESHTDLLPVTTELLNFGSKATLQDQVERLVQHLRS